MRALVVLAALSSLAYADASLPAPRQRVAARWRVNLDDEPDLERVTVLVDADGEHGAGPEPDGVRRADPALEPHQLFYRPVSAFCTFASRSSIWNGLVT